MEADSFWEEVNSRINGLSKTLDVAREGDTLPIVFIVGVPRSGTTLLHQLLVRGSDIGYISNMGARFWKCPRIGVRLNMELIDANDRHSLELTSQLGRTPGATGPHEFGYFWDRWFDFRNRPSDTLSKRALKQIDTELLRRTVRNEIVGEYRRPVVFKNLCLGPQISFVSETLAPCLVLRMRRKSRDNVRSILAARYKMWGNYDRWWSLRPKRFPDGMSKLQPAASVIDQVIGCNEDIDEAIRECREPVMEIQYDRLVRAPNEIVAQVARAMSKRFNVTLALSSVGEIGRSQRKWPLPDNLVEAIDREMPAWMQTEEG